MKINRPQFLIHLAGCICFLALPFIFRPGTFSELDLLHDPRTKSDFLVYLLLLGFFYLNFLLLVPRFFFTQRYLVYFGIIILCFLFITFLPDLLIPFKQMPFQERRQLPGHPHGNFFFDKTSRHFFIFTAVILFSLLLKISTRWRLAEKEKLNTELSYLRSQVNPHFLFNTLNSIYSLAIDKSDETANAIVMLSGMMRYVLNETNRNFVPLQKELDYMDDYISFQKIRFGDSFPFNFQITGEREGKQIAPLILMSFIENAFKHGINAAEQMEIDINIKIESSELTLFVFNKKVSIHLTEANSGVGIENTRKRLQLLYPGNHTISVNNEKNSFSVLLKLGLI